MGTYSYPDIAAVPRTDPGESIARGFALFEEAYEKERKRREMEAALRGPVAQSMISGVMGEDPTTMPGLPPSLDSQAYGTNRGAIIMGPTVGHDVPVLGSSVMQGSGPEEIVIGKPPPPLTAGQRALLEVDPDALGPQQWMEGTGLPGSTAFGESMTVQGRGMMGPRGPIPSGPARSPRAPMTAAEYGIVKDLAPYYTQMASVRESGRARLGQQRERQTAEANMKSADRAIKLLELNERRLKRLQDMELGLKRIAAKKGGGNDMLKILRTAAKDAQDAMSEVQNMITAMDAQGASAAEPGSPQRENYDRARAQLEQAKTLYTTNNGLYQTALQAWLGGAKGSTASTSTTQSTTLKITSTSPDTDWANLSDEQLRQLAAGQ